MRKNVWKMDLFIKYYKIEFKFEPSSFDTGENISFASSAILLILLLGVFYNELKI